MSIAAPIAAKIKEINSHRCTLTLPEVSISYLQWHDQGEPVLLLHGLADCAAVWVGLMESLGDRYQKNDRTLAKVQDCYDQYF
jgi:predicted YcjX-like family ATPase